MQLAKIITQNFATSKTLKGIGGGGFTWNV